MLQGAGAGAKPTASAMVSDMIQLLQKMHNENQQKPFVKASFTSIEEISFEYFLEFTVNDKVGVLESVSHLFSQHSISIKSMLQDNKKPSVEKSVHLMQF